MDRIIEIIASYLTSNNPPGNLVIKSEDTSFDGLLAKSGFTQSGEFWVISREDATELVKSYFGIFPIDLSRQNMADKQERERSFMRSANN